MLSTRTLPLARQARVLLFPPGASRLMSHCCYGPSDCRRRPLLRFFTSSNNDDNKGPKITLEDLKLALHASSDQDEDQSSPEIPGTKTGGKKLAIIFTCTVCNTRSAKQFTERAYNHGVVIVRCPGCQNLHLIADRLGFFEDDGWDVEKAMERMGEEVKVVTDDSVLELTLKDLMGDKELTIDSHDVSEFADENRESRKNY